MWWLIVNTPQGTYAWPVWEDGEPADEKLLNAARVVTGFPADNSWVNDGSGYDIQMTLDTPHPSLLSKATVGTVEDLRAVSARVVDAHANERATAARAAAVEDARAVLASLDPEVLAAALELHRGS